MKLLKLSLSSRAIATTIIFFSLIVALLIIPIAKPKETEALVGNQYFGGRFTSIEEICCDGSMILEFESVESGLPDGSFKTSLTMDAYSNMYYYPMPNACAVGQVRSGGTCYKLLSYPPCRDTARADYTITRIGSSFPGCEFVDTNSSF